MLQLRRISKLPLKRCLSTSSNVLEHLSNRNLIRVAGFEVADYLQGLITNDINHLNPGPGSLYAMFLNTQGRVLYESIIYKTSENDTFLVECDQEISRSLEKLLKMYRVRRKIDVTDIGDSYKMYALFNSNKDAIITELSEFLPESSSKTHQDLIIYKDPRVSLLGNRIIAKSDINVSQQLSEIVKLDENLDKSKNYRWLRYSLGVGEGIRDLPPGNCFPLECNCDYLHGVSFHKGCYIGQELTARIYHTGVIRKRLMPLHFTKIPCKSPDESIVHGKINLGKFRGIENDAGLGLLRIAKALPLKEIQIGDGLAVARVPSWWPVEVSKEKINVQKAE